MRSTFAGNKPLRKENKESLEVLNTPREKRKIADWRHWRKGWGKWSATPPHPTCPPLLHA